MDFYKYHGTGNDFIIIDNRDGHVALAKEQVAALCHRRFGIGADGLMLLDYADGYDFRMVYYNSDGGESTMCGNGGRCMAAFAKSLGIVHDSANFLAADGAHAAAIGSNGIVSLHMQDVKNIDMQEAYTLLNTGSPHFVQWVTDVKALNVYSEGKKIRSRTEFQPGGVNVNFIQMLNKRLFVRTYERGVEEETMSCGTGVVASAIAATAKFSGAFTTEIETPGGLLEVSFTKDTPHSATDVVLKGPAVFVFKGTIALS